MCARVWARVCGRVCVSQSPRAMAGGLVWAVGSSVHQAPSVALTCAWCVPGSNGGGGGGDGGGSLVLGLVRRPVIMAHSSPHLEHTPAFVRQNF